MMIFVNYASARFTCQAVFKQVLIISRKFPRVFLTADRLWFNKRPKRVDTLIKHFVLLINNCD